MNNFSKIRALVGRKNSLMFLAIFPIGILMGAAEIAFAYTLQAILNKFNLITVGGKSHEFFETLSPIPIFISITILIAILRFAMQLLPALAHSAFETRMHEKIIKDILLAPEEKTSLGIVDVNYLISSLTHKVSAFFQTSTAAAGTLTISIFVVCSLLAISVKLTALTGLGLIFCGIPLIYIRRNHGKSVDETNKVCKLFLNSFLKAVQNSQYLKICGLSLPESGRIVRISRLSYEHIRRSSSIHALSSNLPFALGSILIIIILYLNKEYTLTNADMIIPYLYLLNRLIGSISNMAVSAGALREQWPYLRDMFGYFNRFFSSHDGSFANASTCPSLPARDRVRHLEVRDLEFGRGKSLAEPLNFSAKNGDVVLVTGPSGKGKTTLILTLVGLLPPHAGDVIWAGKSGGSIDPTEIRGHVGYAGPDPYLLDDTIRANLLFGLTDPGAVTDAEISRALEVTCCNFVYEMPGGLSYQLKDNGDGISAGQKQRLALARCVLRQPDILLLDEATANIDEGTEAVVIDRMHAYLSDAIFLAISHRSSLRSFASKLIEL